MATCGAAPGAKPATLCAHPGVEATKTGFAALFFRDKPKQGHPEEQRQEPVQQANAIQEPSQVRNNPSLGCAFWGPSAEVSGPLLPPRDSSLVDADEVLLGNQKQGAGVAPPDQPDAPVDFSVKPLQNSESLEQVGNEARGSQPSSMRISQVPATQLRGSDGVAIPFPNLAQGTEAGRKMLSPDEQLSRDPQAKGTEANSARVPQPAGKESTTRSSVASGGTGSSSCGKPKPKAKKTRDTSSTPSVLHFFRKQG